MTCNAAQKLDPLLLTGGLKCVLGKRRTKPSRSELYESVMRGPEVLARGSEPYRYRCGSWERAQTQVFAASKGRGCVPTQPVTTDRMARPLFFLRFAWGEGGRALAPALPLGWCVGDVCFWFEKKKKKRTRPRRAVLRKLRRSGARNGPSPLTHTRYSFCRFPQQADTLHHLRMTDTSLRFCRVPGDL